MDYSRLPSAFYRASVKALIFDDQQRILVYRDEDGVWEMPGGGWDHGESLEECIRRELKEEIRATTTHIGQIRFAFEQLYPARQFHKLFIAVPVKVESYIFTPAEDELEEARFVTRDEFMALNWNVAETSFTDFADKIWND